MTKFIVIAGKKQSGKDTLANMIQAELVGDGIPAKIVSFADPLKKMCNIVFGIPMELMYGSDEDKETLTTVDWDGLPMDVRLKYSNDGQQVTDSAYEPWPRSGPMTVREVLQVIGTDIFRERVWGDVWAAAPFKAEHDEDFVIIPDCRFPNEVEYAQQHGTLIRVRRLTGLTDSHASETALDDTPDTAFYSVYENNGTLDDLESYAQAIVQDLLS